VELRHLRYFVAVADHLHFGRAAAALRTAQPSLSQQIRKLERELGVDLFERSRHVVRLTPAGQAFLREARDLVARSERSIALAREAAAGSFGTVRLGFSLASLGHALLDGLHRFAVAQPLVALEPACAPDRVLIQTLHAGRLEAAFAQTRPEGESNALGLGQAPHGTYRLAAVVPRRHALAGGAEIDLAALRGERLLAYARTLDEELYARVLEACGDGGYDPPSIQEVGDETALLASCSAGFGVAVVPQPWDALRVEGAVFRALNPAPREIGISLFWRIDALGGPLDSFLAEFLPPERYVAARAPSKSRTSAANCSS